MSAAQSLAVGDLNINLEEDKQQKDEIGFMFRAFDHVIESYKKVNAISEAVAQGDYSHYLPKRSDNDHLADSINVMMDKRRDAEAALRESEQTFRNLIANVPGVIYQCLIDDNWTVKFASDAFQHLTGYPAEDLIDNRSRTFASLVYPADRERVEKELFGMIDEDNTLVLNTASFVKTVRFAGSMIEGRLYEIETVNQKPRTADCLISPTKNALKMT